MKVIENTIKIYNKGNNVTHEINAFLGFYFLLFHEETVAKISQSFAINLMIVQM